MRHTVLLPGARHRNQSATSSRFFGGQCSADDGVLSGRGKIC
jgi:hypothetical protein